MTCSIKTSDDAYLVLENNEGFYVGYCEDMNNGIYHNPNIKSDSKLESVFNKEKVLELFNSSCFLSKIAAIEYAETLQLESPSFFGVVVIAEIFPIELN